MSNTRIGLEIGSTWVFAALFDEAGRYGKVAGPGFRAATPEVIGRVTSNATTDFGAPGTPGAWDEAPLEAGEPARLLGLLHSSWAGFDGAVSAAPAALPKGPGGGGRDRDGIVEHVREMERRYARKIGVRVPPRTAWNEQRAAITDTLLQAGTGTTAVWPPRCFIRRTAWHVLDHAWELEDKSR